MSSRTIGAVLLTAMGFASIFSTQNANGQCNGGRGASGRSSSNAPGFGTGTSSTGLSSAPSFGGFPNNDVAYQRMVGMQQQMLALQQQMMRQQAELVSLRNQLAEERSAAQQQLLAERKEKSLQRREERLATLKTKADGVKMVSAAAPETALVVRSQQQ